MIRLERKRKGMTSKHSPSLEQAWEEIRDTMRDKLLNEEQKKQFVISILKGQLANPPTESRYRGYNG